MHYCDLTNFQDFCIYFSEISAIQSNNFTRIDYLLNELIVMGRRSIPIIQITMYVLTLQDLQSKVSQSSVISQSIY